MIKILITIIVFSLVIFLPEPAFAASGKMEISPASVTAKVGEKVNVSVKLNGGGTPFISARGAVIVSPPLSITNLTLGDCGFSFVITPTKEKPSFAGAVLGGSISSCTVFTLSVVSNSQGTGTISIDKGSLISIGDYSQLLNSVQNGNYIISNNAVTITSVPAAPYVPVSLSSIKPTKIPSISSYSVFISAQDASGNPLVGVTITSSDGSKAVSDKNGVAVFNNVKAGVYHITLESNKGKTEEVIGVSGENPQLSFSIKEGTTKSSSIKASEEPQGARGPIYNIYIVFAAIIAAGVVVGVIIFLKVKSKI